MREYVLRTPYRGFIAIPSSGEVTYVWNTGPDEVAMRTVYGKEMPGHCALYFSPASTEATAGKPRQATRRLSCLRLAAPSELNKPESTVVRLGPPPVEPDALQRLFCVCAPVRDYTGQEVARVGVFGHGADDRPILNDHHRGAWDLARRISMRLGQERWLSTGATLVVQNVGAGTAEFLRFDFKTAPMSSSHQR